MSGQRRPPAAATDDDSPIDRMVNLLTTSDAPAMARLADAMWTWAACVDYEFRRRFPLEHAVWRATVIADGLAAAGDDPIRPACPRH